MKHLALISAVLGSCFCASSQNVGIGTSVPTYSLDVVSSNAFDMRVSNNASSTVGILFKNNVGVVGSFGAFQNQLTIDDANGSGIALRSGGADRLTVSALGRVGIGVAAASTTEQLEIGTGNIKLNNSNRGIMLNGADRPLITRGFDPFTSGNFVGNGRWGLFMEFNQLTLGMPNAPNKSIGFATYAENSTRQDLLSIDTEGRVNRPASGGYDMLPIAMGIVNADGTMLNSTPNLHVSKSSPSLDDFTFTFTVDGITFSAAEKPNYLVMVTIIRTGNGTARAESLISASGLTVRTYPVSAGTEAARPFQIVIYRLN